MKVTSAAINKRLAVHGDVRLVKGSGYFYLIGEVVSGAYSTSIFTPYLTDYTVDEWVAECEQIIAEAREEQEFSRIMREGRAAEEGRFASA